MAGRRGGLKDVKGGELLASLHASLSPARPAVVMPHERPDLADAMKRRARAPQPPTKKAVVATKPKNTKPDKERVKLPADVKAAVLASFTQAIVAGEPPVERRAAYDFGENGFRRVSSFRAALDEFIASHGAPCSVLPGTTRTIDRLIASGPGIEVNPDDGFYIGLDFGTSTTKAVLRHPYMQIAFAAPVPDEIAAHHAPHLWPTAVFFDPTLGSFSLYPTAGSIALTGFKSALIERNAHRICNGSTLTMLEAAVAFLTLYIAQLLGSLRERHANAEVAGIHVAVPVAALADEARKSAFLLAVRAALRLLPDAPGLTIDHVRIAASMDDVPSFPHELHTELTGAIAGYCTQPRRYAGAHMIIDCGSATLDIASFHLSGGRWPAGIHSAQVERLGADACALYQRKGVSADDCSDASRFQEHCVFRGALDRDPGGYRQSEHRRYSYQVILVGGGMQGELHANLFDQMEQAFERPFQRPEVARDLSCDPATDPTRLIIADGLARDPIELREVFMPGDRVVETRSPMPDMITKDQV